jgi:hypothetical protein
VAVATVVFVFAFVVVIVVGRGPVPGRSGDTSLTEPTSVSSGRLLHLHHIPSCDQSRYPRWCFSQFYPFGASRLPFGSVSAGSPDLNDIPKIGFGFGSVHHVRTIDVTPLAASDAADDQIKTVCPNSRIWYLSRRGPFLTRTSVIEAGARQKQQIM